jgi:uncharacterized protein
LNVEELRSKFNGLLASLRKKESVLVAFSGGVDSSLLCAAAKISLGKRAVAVTANSTTLPPWELEEARRVANNLRVKHLIVNVNELRNPQFVENPPDRCYYCKKELLSELKRVAKREGLTAVVDGTNAEDLKHHRPGVRALLEEGVSSPLAEAGLTKEEIRIIADMLGLPTAKKPSMACLASRIPYGQRITAEKLSRIAKAESLIRRTLGVEQLRVRDYGDLARIEVGKGERNRFFDERVMDLIVDELKSLGYSYITMDLEGYREGSMDEVLGKRLNRADFERIKVG